MNKADKIRFIESMCDHVKARALGVVDQMPEEWAGIELRLLLVDYMAEICGNMRKNKRYKAKVRAYQGTRQVTTI